MKSLNIIHLDDHELFQQALKETILSKYPDSNISHFTDSQMALLRLQDSMENKNAIHLIVTDYTHRGENGIAFAKRVRNLEEDLGVRTPILLLTLRSIDNEIQIALDQRVIDGYLPKASSSESLLDFVSSILEN